MKKRMFMKIGTAATLNLPKHGAGSDAIQYSKIILR